MQKRFGTFVLRCWLLPDGTQRLELEHIPSGERQRATTLHSLEDWIIAHVTTPPGAAPPTPPTPKPDKPTPP